MTAVSKFKMSTFIGLQTEKSKSIKNKSLRPQQTVKKKLTIVQNFTSNRKCTKFIQLGFALKAFVEIVGETRKTP